MRCGVNVEIMSEGWDNVPNISENPSFGETFVGAGSNAPDGCEAEAPNAGEFLRDIQISRERGACGSEKLSVETFSTFHTVLSLIALLAFSSGGSNLLVEGVHQS